MHNRIAAILNRSPGVQRVAKMLAWLKMMSRKFRHPQNARRMGGERERGRAWGGLTPVLSATFHPSVDNLSRSYTPEPQTSSVINRDKRVDGYIFLRFLSFSFSSFFFLLHTFNECKRCIRLQFLLYKQTCIILCNKIMFIVPWKSLHFNL